MCGKIRSACVAMLLMFAPLALAASHVPAGLTSGAHQFLDLRDVVPEHEPNNSCQTEAQQLNCGDRVDPAMISSATDVDWYTVYLQAGALVSIGTSAGTNCVLPLRDSYLELYAADCLTLLAADDNGGPDNYSLISDYPVPETGWYNIKVRGHDPSFIGCYILSVDCVAPPPPPPPGNDTCAGAILLSRCTSGTLSGDLTSATNDYSPQPPIPGCTGTPADGHDVVYSVSLLTGDHLSLSYSGGFDQSIYVVSDCSDVGATCVAGANEHGPGETETIDWTCTADGTYFIICDAYGLNAGGPFSLQYAITCPSTGACCLANGDCIVVTAEGCTLQQGIYQGDSSTCQPINPCPQPVPTEGTTWGLIKKRYQ
jgi:hypothetical protein